MAFDSIKASAIILVIALSCSGAPLQETGNSESGVSKQTTPRNATVSGDGGPAADAKGPANGAEVPVVPSNPATGARDSSPPDHGTQEDYKIGAGDVLHIGVFHEPDASVQSVVVRTDGRISMPLLKEVSVMGLTPSELEAKLTEGLSKFLPAPDVTVVVTAINSKKIYIMGAVRHEGPLSLTHPMNVLQALAEAGGPTDFAKRKKIYVLRKNGGKEVKLPFNYDAALKGEHMELNVPLAADDIIVVPGE